METGLVIGYLKQYPEICMRCKNLTEYQLADYLVALLVESEPDLFVRQELLRLSLARVDWAYVKNWVV